MSGSRRYPDRPILGVGAIILDGERVLLVERAQPPLAGYWSLPGGVLETGETLQEGVRREKSRERSQWVFWQLLQERMTARVIDRVASNGTLERLIADIALRETDPYTAVEDVLRRVGL